MPFQAPIQVRKLSRQKRHYYWSVIPPLLIGINFDFRWERAGLQPYASNTPTSTVELFRFAMRIALQHLDHLEQLSKD
jgi:hypothetical protein